MLPRLPVRCIYDVCGKRYIQSARETEIVRERKRPQNVWQNEAQHNTAPYIYVGYAYNIIIINRLFIIELSGVSPTSYVILYERTCDVSLRISLQWKLIIITNPLTAPLLTLCEKSDPIIIVSKIENGRAREDTTRSCVL